MKDVKSSMVQVWCIIANALTNTGRANESSPNSKDNLALIDNFSTPVLGRCGWSSDFPAIIVSMKNWFFEKGHDTVYKDAGCTAQEYILKEMEERAKTLQRLVDAVKNAKNEQLRSAELELQNYREIYCDAKGELNKLTLANAYWVDSGHQRLEWVFIPARLKWLTMKDIADKANAEAQKLDPKFVPAEFATFDTTIPAKIREYTNYDEIVDTQYRGNNDAANQNRLTWKDYTKAAYRRIGAGTVPKVSESEFRAGGGEGPRRGYQYARLARQFGSSFHLYEGFMAAEKVKLEGSKEPVPNPEFIPESSISLGNKYDPMKNASVINRLCDQSLEDLKLYIKRNGPGREKPATDKGPAEPLPDLSSAIEKEVLSRGKAWTKEEFAAWVETIKIHGPGYKALVDSDPNATPKDQGLDKEMVKGILASSSLSPAFQKAIKDVRDGNKNEDNALGVFGGLSGEAVEVVIKTDAAFQNALVQYGVLVDGSPETAQAVAAAFVKTVNDAVASLQKTAEVATAK